LAPLAAAARSRFTFYLAAGVLLLFAPTALAQEVPPQGSEQTPPAQPAPAEIEIELEGVKGKDVRVNRRVLASATVRPFVAGEALTIGFYRGDKAVKKERIAIEAKKGSQDAGLASLRSSRFVEPGKYSVRAVHEETEAQAAATASSGAFGVDYPQVGGRDSGDTVKLFNDLLDRAGYGNASRGKRFGGASARAVHAFRKTNGMARTEKATPEVFRMLADGKGEFRLRHPGAGRHVEVDISRQVMVLADGGKPRFTYHISSGAPGTPSDRGHFKFYRRQPGFNSLGMYYSVYYNGGEAVHGYKSVPNYPASHGCIRQVIADARFVYDWVRLGDDIWVYD
jgi:hypothetical protein